MKDKGNKNQSVNQPMNGEISTIRDILMGAHIAEYEANFLSIRELLEKSDIDVDTRIKALEKNVNERFADLEQNTTKWLDALEKNMNKRFEESERLLQAKVSELDEKINKVSQVDKANLGEMLAHLSKNLINNG